MPTVPNILTLDQKTAMGRSRQVDTAVASFVGGLLVLSPSPKTPLAIKGVQRNSYLHANEVVRS